MAGIPPPPPNFFPGETAGGGFETRYEIKGFGFDQIVADIWALEANWARDSADVLALIARDFRKGTQERSPYLYGILQGAHFDKYGVDSEQPYGLVAIDPSVWHPILGGRPNLYGARIHSEDRPWFVWTINEEGQQILERYGADLAGVYADYLNNPFIDFFGGPSGGLF